MGSLVEIQEELKFNTDKHRMAGKKRAHTYLPEYDRLFAGFKDEPINILEVGVLDGSSLRLWAEYFTNANIYGIDKWRRVSLKKVESKVSKYENISLYTVDSVGDKGLSSRNKFFEVIADKQFHIIIDDGDHKPTSQVKTFNNFIDKLHPDGVYIIEDIWDWDKHGHSCKCTQTGLQHIQENIPDIEIIDMNHIKGIYNDNVLGIYHKTFQ